MNFKLFLFTSVIFCGTIHTSPSCKKPVALVLTDKGRHLIELLTAMADPSNPQFLEVSTRDIATLLDASTIDPEVGLINSCLLLGSIIDRKTTIITKDTNHSSSDESTTASLSDIPPHDFLFDDRFDIIRTRSRVCEIEGLEGGDPANYRIGDKSLTVFAVKFYGPHATPPTSATRATK